MASFVLGRIRRAVLLTLLPLIGIAAVCIVWVVARANRVSETEEATAEAEVNEAEPTTVQIGREQLLSAAGIEVEPVVLREFGNTISCYGNASFNQNKYVKVPSKASGVLRKINVDVGSAVQVGDVLAVVNSQAVGDLKAALLNAIVHEEHLAWQVEKYTNAQEGIAAKMLYESKHLLEEQRVETARIRDRLREYGFSTRQIEEIQTSKDITVQLPVYAPRDGAIVHRQAVEGEPVDTVTPLFAIADLESMWLNLYVYEIQLPQIHLGQSVSFVPDGLPGHAFTGKITWVSPEVDAQTRTIQLRAEVRNVDAALRANMFGTAELTVEKPQERIVVSQAAVQKHRGEHVVFVQKGGDLFEVRKVAVGLKHDQVWEVVSGLQPGEKVATTGSFLLKSNLENPDFGKVE